MKSSLVFGVVWPCALVAVAVSWHAPGMLTAPTFAGACTVLALVAARLLGLDRRILVRRPDAGARTLTLEILRCARYAESHGLAALNRPGHRPRNPLLRFALDLARQGLDPRLVRGAVLDRCEAAGAPPDDSLADCAMRSWRQLLRTELTAGGGIVALVAGAAVLVVTGPHELSEMPGIATAALLAGGMLVLAAQFTHFPSRAMGGEHARLVIAGAAAIAAGRPVAEIEQILQVIAAGEDAGASVARAA